MIHPAARSILRPASVTTALQRTYPRPLRTLKTSSASTADQSKISFPEDSPGFQRQKDLLESEGVVFINGKIDLERYGYRGAVDRLLWGDDLSL